MLSFDPDTVELPQGHFIGGRFVPMRGELPLHRPSDGVHYTDCPVAGADLVDEAVTTARRAWTDSGWGRLRPRDRTRALHRWADLIEADTPNLARLEALCSTRPIAQVGDIDIAITAEQIRFFAEMADKESTALAPTDDASFGMVMDEPYGVVGAITPWNFPLSMAGWKLGPALAAGNAVVLKPSEMTPFSTLRLAELSVQAGMPAGLITIVLGDGPTTGTAVTGHPGVAKVSFTGSTAAGSAIMQTIARTGIKPMTLELGGKSPQLVFADADIKRASLAVARGILANAGQACVAGSRLIVARAVAEEVIAAIAQHMEDIQPGPTWDEATGYSPIISARQLDRVGGIVQAAIAGGAQCLTGAAALQRPGYFYAPTLLAGLDAASPALREEIFGPVLTIQIFDEEEEALALADHPAYGLAAGLFTQDLSRALRVTRRLQAGTVWVNRYGRSRDHILPPGGYKRSGIGKDLGREAYLANRQSKSVLIGL
jgi:aldehyde dehydrogenase (NAD+)